MPLAMSHATRKPLNTLPVLPAHTGREPGPGGVEGLAHTRGRRCGNQAHLFYLSPHFGFTSNATSQSYLVPGDYMDVIKA